MWCKRKKGKKASVHRLTGKKKVFDQFQLDEVCGNEVQILLYEIEPTSHFLWWQNKTSFSYPACILLCRNGHLILSSGNERHVIANQFERERPC